jgi:two-component system response regulator FlrC
MSERILVVDDDPQMALAMSRVLRRREWIVDVADGGEQALSLLARRDHRLVISDLRMPGMDGRELLRRIRALRPDAAVIVVTAYATVESAVSCVRDGALNYLQKPFSPESLEQAVEEVLRRAAERDEAGCVASDFVAHDPATIEVVELALRAAGTSATVLLEAESGAGKEVFARFIHRRSARAAGPFVAVNCAALPRELLEAELFGHARGAFTGALRDRRGHFQIADGGTLLLDEVGEMSADLQSRLLRVLQDRRVQPVGAEAPIQVDVRVVAATNRNLRDEVAHGRFREDLYYRLHVLPIRIPPLRERPADVEPLAQRFARRHAGPQARLTRAALERLQGHPWPGNVRELENVIQRAAIHAGDGPIEARHLELEPAPSARIDGCASALSLEAAEWEAIRQALAESAGNRTDAAATLGISPRTLRHKLKRYRDAGMPVVESSR